MATELAAAASGGGGSMTTLSPLDVDLAQTSTSFLEPSAFFVSWQGVLTLAYSGFTVPLVDLKRRIDVSHPALPPENPGSRWPKTSLGCLRDGKRLTPQQLAQLCQICREESSGIQQQQQQLGMPLVDAAPSSQGAETMGEGLRLAIDSASVVLFECRSLEAVLSFKHVMFQGGVEVAGPSAEERARVAAILREPEAPDYWFAASRDGNRESHYRGRHLGATLMHPLELWPHGGAEDTAAAHAARPGLRMRGVRELADRRALLAAIERFRQLVDAALPDMYVWFSDASLHITLRALIN